jgi:hypothetical protein
VAADVSPLSILNWSRLTSAATKINGGRAQALAICKDLDSVWVWFYTDVAPMALEMFWRQRTPQTNTQ